MSIIIDYIKILHEILFRSKIFLRRESYGFESEDLYINEYLKNIQNGFYVDIGAFNPIRGSNTYLLYKRGWSGMHALDILRLEKKFLHWGHDITSENNPFESKLSFAVNFKKKENFIGREALEKIKDKPSAKRLELFSLKNRFKPGTPLLLHDEPVFKNDRIIGHTTSSNFSFCYKKNLCLAYIKGEIMDNDELYIEVEGKKYLLKLEKLPIHDPSSKLMRS